MNEENNNLTIENLIKTDWFINLININKKKLD